MRLFSLIFRTSRWLSTLAILTGLIGGAIGTGLVVLVYTALRSASANQMLVWGFAGLCGLFFISRFTTRWLLAYLAHTALFQLRLHLARRILPSPLSHLETLGTHRILATLTDDIDSLTHAFANAPQVGMNLAVFIACLVYLGSLSWRILLGVLGFVALGVMSYYFIIGQARSRLRRARRTWDTLFHHFRALTEGIKELKLHADRRQAFIDEVFEPTAASLRHQHVIGRCIYAMGATWGQLLFFMVLGLLLFALPAYYEVGTPTLTAYVLVFLYMRTPLESLVQILPMLGQANVALERIEELGLSLKANAIDEPARNQHADTPFETELAWRDVTCTYAPDDESNPFTLGPLTLTFRPGQLIFLVGGNGSGKTTFAKLFAGLYAPTTGAIDLDGTPITDANREAYRQHFSAVFSDFYIFNRLIGLEAPDLDARARAHLTHLHLDHKVEITNGALSTTNLSHGQRKRLALLTAYLEDRAIYVFDEWAADQDPFFKELFYRDLLPALQARGKTVLVISHDDRYYSLADRIIKLEYGQVELDTDAAPPQNPELHTVDSVHGAVSYPQSHTSPVFDRGDGASITVMNKEHTGD